MGALGVGGEFCVKNACYYSKIIFLITARFTSFWGACAPLKTCAIYWCVFGSDISETPPPPRTILLKIDAI